MTKKTTIDFPVAGAGILRVGTIVAITGHAAGPSIGVSWGDHGFTPGVLSASEIPRLIATLQALLDEINRDGGEDAVYDNRIEQLFAS